MAGLDLGAYHGITYYGGIMVGIMVTVYSIPKRAASPSLITPFPLRVSVVAGKEKCF